MTSVVHVRMFVHLREKALCVRKKRYPSRVLGGERNTGSGCEVSTPTPTIDYLGSDPYRPESVQSEHFVPTAMTSQSDPERLMCSRTDCEVAPFAANGTIEEARAPPIVQAYPKQPR